MPDSAPLSRRAVLAASVGPYAAVVIVREFGPQMEAYAASMAASGSEVDRQVAREIQGALAQLREAARQLRERRREMPTAAPTSVSGSAEVADSRSSADCELSSSEAAAELGVSVRWIRGLCLSGSLAATRRGRTWWITRQALDDHLSTSRRAG